VPEARRLYIGRPTYFQITLEENKSGQLILRMSLMNFRATNFVRFDSIFPPFILRVGKNKSKNLFVFIYLYVCVPIPSRGGTIKRTRDFHGERIVFAKQHEKHVRSYGVRRSRHAHGKPERRHYVGDVSSSAVIIRQFRIIPIGNVHIRVQ